jgi:hypothetical protein
MAKNRAAVALGRRGGQSSSAAKARAARENGKKGGRRPKPRIGLIAINRGDAITIRVDDGMILVNGKDTGIAIRLADGMIPTEQLARIKRGTS